jgi:GNAT superfamily N-acetyltransferase
MYYLTKGFSRIEINQAVQIQLNEISQGFLSSIGEKGLGLIFRYVAESRWCIMVLAIDEVTEKVIGYVIGTISSDKLYRDFLVKKLPAALFYFLPRMLSWQRLVKAFETIRYPWLANTASLPQAELLDMAVSSAYHSRGVAQGLFRNFEKECRNQGVNAFKIPTGEFLKRAHRFYEKMGAVKAGAFELHRGGLTFVYLYRLSFGPSNNRGK